MKKRLALILTLVLLSTLSGCFFNDHFPETTANSGADVHTGLPESSGGNDPVDEPNYTDPAEKTTPEPGTPEEIAFWKEAAEHLDYYKEVALDAEFGSRDGKVHKWTEAISLYVYPGVDADKYMDFIEAHLETLNGIEGFPGVSLTDDIDAAGLTLEFVSYERMKELLGSDGQGSQDAYGYVNVSWYNIDCRIFKGRIYIVREADSSEADVRHTIIEETTQAMGLMNDSVKDSRSIFYQGYSIVDRLSDVDLILLKIHYSDRVKGGMVYEEIKEIAAALANR